MQKKPSMTPTQFNNLYSNPSIIQKIEGLILNSKTDAQTGKGTNLPNVSALSRLEVTHDNIPQMKQLRDELSAVRKAFHAKADAELKQTTELGDSKLTGFRNVLTESHIKSIEQFDKSFQPFVTKIDTTIADGLKALPMPSDFDEEKIAELQKMPAINHNTIKVDLNDNKSNFANNTVTNINSTVIKNKVAKNTKNACCTIF
jgi:hypothetical protein